MIERFKLDMHTLPVLIRVWFLCLKTLVLGIYFELDKLNLAMQAMRQFHFPFTNY